MFKFITPKTKAEIKQYYRLRWSLLRRPLGGKRGSEIDDLEKTSFHKAIVEDRAMIGVGRIHFINDIAQIRYMAVKNHFSRQGLGSKMITELEKIAKGNKIKKIYLNSRIDAVKFYENNGYSKIREVKPSFGSIVHYRMEKILKKL